MRKLRRAGAQAAQGGRAAVVVPNGTLFGDGVSARIKEELLREFDLHTVVRLPNGVFAPYTAIPTNLLFFRRGGPTRAIWYYEQPLPEGRKSYSKTKPLRYEEFAPLLAWWQRREDNEHAWRVPVAEVLKYDDSGALLSANLDLKNPHSGDALEHLAPEALVDGVIAKERRIFDIMHEIKILLEDQDQS
jgi:type I restriction enzyme M protein